MQPPEKINTKGALFVRMLVFEKQLVVSISLNNYMPLENRKKSISILGSFNLSLSKYIPAEKKIRKNKNSKDFLLYTKLSIFNQKFGKLLRGIWKIKSSVSNLNLCLLNQLAQVTNSRG